jgi:hypothetical protein
MDNRSFESASSASPPTAPGSPSVGYPTNGNPGTGTPATKPGAYWFHQLGEEIRNVITAAGLTPASGTLTQLLSALTAGWNLPKSAAVPGYIKMPGGIIVQWGVISTSASSGVTLTFPTAYTVGSVTVVTMGGNTSAVIGTTEASGTPLSTVIVHSWSSGSTRVAGAAAWVSIGV